MIRAIGIFGFAGGFVAVSPNLRQMGAEAVLAGTTYLTAHSPYSYVLAAAGALAMMLLLARSATAVR